MGNYFDAVFASHHLHMAKPNQEIFDHVVQQTGLVPEETLYVDDLEKNRKAGERFAGWKTAASIEELRKLI